MDKNRQIEQLVNRYLDGEIDEEEYKELLHWYNSFDDSSVEIVHHENISLSDIKERMYDRILEKNNNSQERPVSKTIIPNWRWIASIAASISILFGLWIFYPEQPADYITTIPQQIGEQIKPGSNKAKLILDNGRTIELIDQDGGLIVADEITYANGDHISDLSQINDITIQTPPGATYQVTFSDGSQVWLNAGSTITYPSHFKENTPREINLTGEAYFKVSKKLDAKGQRTPFIVNTQRQQIAVLGTEFNVSDYSQNPYTHTTLVEGKVEVQHALHKYILTPSEQYKLENGSALVTHVSTENYTAWKDGKFDFSNKSLKHILDEISLWYDIKVIYKGDIPNVELTGEAYRNSNFNLILRLLEVGKVEYSLDVRKRELIIK